MIMVTHYKEELPACIDAIYVQERNENTDAQCEAAKAAWRWASGWAVSVPLIKKVC